MLNLIILILGFFPLVIGANMLIDGSSSLAKKLNIPVIVIGLTLVAFGTSMPELTVNVFAAFSESAEISLGNIVGSNLFNILIVLGSAALIKPLLIKKKTVFIEIPFCIFSAVLLLFLANNFFFKNSLAQLSRIDGLILLLFFLVFLIYIFNIMKEGFDSEVEIKEFSIAKSIIYFLIGLVLLIFGGKLIVDSAVIVAGFLGVSQRIIGLTIVAIGTSLPELTTSLVAAKKKNMDIAVGNVVGSNIFNVFLVLGASVFISPINIYLQNNLDLILNIIISTMLLIFIFKSKKLLQWQGLLMIIIYFVYMTFTVLN